MKRSKNGSVAATGLRAALALRDAPEQTLLSAGDATLSVSETLGWFDRLDQILIDAGIEKGERIAVIALPHASSALVLLSLFETYTLLPLNPKAHIRQITDVLTSSQADCLVAPSEFLDEFIGPELHNLASFEILGEPLTICRLRQERSEIANILRKPGIVLHTSGTTGAPKRVPLEAAQLLASAQNIGQHLELSSKDRAVHGLPMFHVGALVDLLLAPMLAGGSVAIASDPSPKGLAHAVLKQGGNWLQLVPTMLTHLLTETPSHTLADIGQRLRFIRMVSADLSESLLGQAERSLQNTPIVQMYGMTETSGQIASNTIADALRPANSVGRISGPDVRLIDPEGAVVENGREGEICVSGSTIMARYEGDDPTPMHGRWFRTGDAGRFDENGYLFLTGRLKEMINRGGEKISPVIVERAAQDHPDVGEAAAFALPHTTLGEQVGLVVTQRAQGHLTEGDLLNHLRGRLSEHEMPRSITFLEALPRLPSGKIDRRDLARQGTGAAEASRELSKTGRIISDLWQKTLSVRAPYDDADFFDDGGDSLTATEFIHMLEKQLNVTLPPNILFDSPRFRQLVEAVDAVDATTGENEPKFLAFVRRKIAGWSGQRVGPRRLLVSRNTISEKTPFVLGVNGIDIADYFGATVLADHPVYLLRSLRHFNGKTIADQNALAQVYAEEVQAVTQGAPVMFGGFCAGSQLAARVANILSDKGQQVTLFVSLDQPVRLQTTYPVLYITSDTGAPYAIYYEPEAAFGYWHPAGSASIRIPGRHVRAMTRENFEDISEQVQAFIEGKPLSKPQARQPSDIADRKALYHAEISGRVPKIWRHKAHVSVPVCVKNTSDQTWQEGKISGLRLVAQFVNFDGHTRLRKAATVEVPHEVPPGESFTAELDMTYADTNLPLILRLSMVDDGYCYFEEHGVATFNRIIWAWPPRKA